MMRIIKFIICLSWVGLLNADLSHGRMSIIPEYDQNMVTILFSGHRADSLNNLPFLFSVPDDVDSVSLIKTKADGNLDFIIVTTEKKKGQKWVSVPETLVEFAFMINSSKFPNPGERQFEYRLSFSEIITHLNLEIQEPIAAENFSYSGFLGESSKDPHGQITHSIQWDLIEMDKINTISFSYLNPRGLTTRSALTELMAISQQKDKPVIKPKKIKRYKLYIWEPLIALGVVSIFIALVLMYSKNQTPNLLCSFCGQKINPSDKFCPKCGEKK